MSIIFREKLQVHRWNHYDSEKYMYRECPVSNMLFEQQAVEGLGVIPNRYANSLAIHSQKTKSFDSLAQKQSKHDLCWYNILNYNCIHRNLQGAEEQDKVVALGNEDKAEGLDEVEGRDNVPVARDKVVGQDNVPVAGHDRLV